MAKKLFIANIIIFSAIAITIVTGYFFGINFLQSQNAVFIASADTTQDTTPPKLSDIKMSNIGTSSMIVTWKTDKKSDSLVNYSLDKNYGISRDSSFTHTSHQIAVDGLKADTTYYFRVISSDSVGNQAISGDYSFTTLTDETTPAQQNNPNETPSTESAPANQQQPKSSQQITQDVIDMLEKITNPEDLIKVSEAIDGIGGGELNPPAVLGAEPQVDVGPDYATIRWVTDRKSNSIVAVASERDYKPDADNPYTWKTGEPTEMTLEHQVQVVNLSPATTYHYQILSTPEVGPEGKSKDYTFKTKSILPEIYNLKLTKVEETAATLTWNTNVPTKAIVEYTNLKTKQTKLAGSSNLVSVNSIRLTDLTLNTTYTCIVHAENEYGEKADSYPITFTTVKDVLAPVISKVNTESTLYPGADSKIQTIISWETDESSVCQFFYQEGISAGKEPSTQPKESDFVTKHVQVVTAFTQATVYKYWIKCNDPTGNEGMSESYSILTPAQEQSILDMIIGNFESTFGWLKKK